jgi:hypothetical protein
MYGLRTKRKLYAGLGDFAKMKQADGLRKKYGTGNANLDRASTIADEAAESAEMPDSNAIAARVAAAKPPGNIDDVLSDADRQNREAASMFAEMDEDEEMQKWMAKQKG